MADPITVLDAQGNPQALHTSGRLTPAQQNAMTTNGALDFRSEAQRKFYDTNVEPRVQAYLSQGNSTKQTAEWKAASDPDLKEGMRNVSYQGIMIAIADPNNPREKIVFRQQTEGDQSHYVAAYSIGENGATKDYTNANSGASIGIGNERFHKNENVWDLMNKAKDGNLVVEAVSWNPNDITGYASAAKITLPANNIQDHKSGTGAPANTGTGAPANGGTSAPAGGGTMSQSTQAIVTTITQRTLNDLRGMDGKTNQPNGVNPQTFFNSLKEGPNAIINKGLRDALHLDKPDGAEFLAKLKANDPKAVGEFASQYGSAVAALVGKGRNIMRLEEKLGVAEKAGGPAPALEQAPAAPGYVAVPGAVPTTPEYVRGGGLANVDTKLGIENVVTKPSAKETLQNQRNAEDKMDAILHPPTQTEIRAVERSVDAAVMARELIQDSRDGKDPIKEMDKRIKLEQESGSRGVKGEAKIERNEVKDAAKQIADQTMAMHKKLAEETTALGKIDSDKNPAEYQKALAQVNKDNAYLNGEGKGTWHQQVTVYLENVMRAKPALEAAVHNSLTGDDRKLVDRGVNQFVATRDQHAAELLRNGAKPLALNGGADIHTGPNVPAGLPDSSHSLGEKPLAMPKGITVIPVTPASQQQQPGM